MKKSFQLLIILLLVSLGLVAIGNRVVMGSAEKVIVDERASFGDKEVAEGLRVNIPVSTIVGYRGDRRGHVLWDTAFVIGESPTVKTEAELSIGPPLPFAVQTARTMQRDSRNSARFSAIMSRSAATASSAPARLSARSATSTR